jgi:HAD superfamily hydrolase (TIGR01509 family)
VTAVLERFDLRAHFAAVVAGESVARLKPEPDIFLHAAACLALEPARCVVLEDSLAGVEAARSAGMAVIAVPERDSARFTALTPFVVTDLHQARRLLSA